MPLSTIEIIALAIVACLLVQHMEITRTAVQREHFYRAWKNYRRHINLCRFLSAVAVVTLVFILTDMGEHELGISKAIANLITKQGYITLIILTFFISLLNLLIESHVETQIRQSTRAPRDIWLHDLWLLWFVASIVFSVAFGAIDAEWISNSINDTGNRGSTDAIHPKHYFALATVLIVTLTYDFWIYNVLYRQLTEGDGFTSSAVSRIYGVDINPDSNRARKPMREFLGFLVRGIREEPPAQVLIIGPKGAGKTHWTMLYDAAYAEYVRAQEGTDTGLLSTQKIETAFTSVPVQVIEQDRRRNTQFSVMLHDFPGENLGDHCNLPFKLRSDVLMLILPESAFNPDLDTKEDLFRLQGAEDISEYFKDDERSVRVRDYMYGLYFGLKMDDSGKDFVGRQRSGVGAFVLLVNHREGNRAYEQKFKEHIQKLAEQVATKFGVRDERFVLSYYYNVNEFEPRLLRTAIGKLHESMDTRTISVGESVE